MEHRALVHARRMRRRFDPDRPVDRAVLTRALRSATRAPSAGWSQGWDFVVLDEPADVAGYWRVAASPGPSDAWLRGVMTAPCLVVVCSDPQRYLDRYAEPDKGWTDRSAERWPVPWWDVDAGMSALLLLLSVQDEGLGGLLCGVPPDRVDAVRTLLGIPADRRVVALLAIGHEPPEGWSATRGSARRGRRPLSETAHLGRWDDPWPEM